MTMTWLQGWSATGMNGGDCMYEMSCLYIFLIMYSAAEEYSSSDEISVHSNLDMDIAAEIRWTEICCLHLHTDKVAALTS